MTEQNLRVLIVDDEKTIRRFLKTTIVSHNYTVIEASNGREALEASISAHPDVIILDLGLPDEDGIDIVRKIRKRSRTPVIILSVREDESDKISALDAGADDYLTKPFNSGELLARLRAVMRRLSPVEEADIFQSGNVCIDISKHLVQINHQEVRLTPTEYDILKLLVLNSGKVVTQKQLIQEIWNKDEETEGAAHLLRVTISHLRSKIEDNPNCPELILTEPGIGYRLSSNV